ncbi:proteasome assembly chaperone 1 isoform X9 [Balaenoptera ricei]|uniref:proteasome assembly chaperone 1 isoform X9 n=1 Tax=Balaenoptera ricei TaxID=2746895 RepID=UPI0028BE9F6B|nr:proteasome assembly chaperone 1 isoform X9 [Balaenoptera ricei]
MAATFFGEVVRAPCRAGTEDEEEEEEEGRRETPEDGEVRQQLARKRVLSQEDKPCPLFYGSRKEAALIQVMIQGQTRKTFCLSFTCHLKKGRCWDPSVQPQSACVWTHSYKCMAASSGTRSPGTQIGRVCTCVHVHACV